jgi:2,4-dienoyl-CoA reductase-like NADH-dependent reductase (Old Yellow Enzyme family)
MDTHDMGDSDRLGTFTYVARELGEREIAFICAREHKAEDWIGPKLKKAFGGVYIANENFTQESAQAALDAGEADAVAWGRTFIANPDLVERFARNAPLNELDASTMYVGGAHGYTDYPTLEKTPA